MIWVKYYDNDALIGVQFKRISDNVVSVVGNFEANTSGFKTISSKGSVLGDFRDYKTIYRLIPDNAEVQYSNDGSVYVSPSKEDIVAPREPSSEEIKQMLIDGVQNWMDEIAMTRGYDGILSACSYIDTGVERFDIEGAQARKWRSQVWAYCYAYLDDVLAGRRTIPSIEELIAQLPKLNW